MSDLKKIQSALISVFYKDGLEPLVKSLHLKGISIFATGGTQTFIENLGVPVTAVEDVTSYPSILGGRVKTLHPKVFGGILGRRENAEDVLQLEQYEIPPIDLVIVDLYPFEETVKSSNDEAEIIEKIDIGGISLIRAAAKNLNDVVIIASVNDYPVLQNILDNQDASTTKSDRKNLAAKAFAVSSHYDTAIYNWFSNSDSKYFKQSINQSMSLRYGENPHQQGTFFGNLDDVFDKLHGKELSYNNLLDVDAAVGLIAEFSEPTIAILKHNNACGCASATNLEDAWKAALAGDPVSAFGGVIISNKEISKQVAAAMNSLFFEIIIAPTFDTDALEILKEKKNRIILKQKSFNHPAKQFRSVLHGVLEQDRDNKSEKTEELKTATSKQPTQLELENLLFAMKICKHSKSNTIVLAKNKQLIGSGVGMTSRVDALKHAIGKAKEFKHELSGAVMASDAFFPFPDCVQIANAEGIKAVIQPGGSIKDQDSIDYCNANNMTMVITGIRHFKH